ncbi:MAG: phosphoglycolate phosphatase [Acidobacteria bacterium]|nr:MAG: phosphoglycolate phosphatase [Acidobacteriota bacterium]
MLIVFDLDGTLVDSRRDLADAANALLVERGGAPLPIDRIAAMVGEGAALLVRRALAAAGLDPEPPEALQRFLALYDQRLLNHTTLYDGIAGALATLQPRADLAVLTNKPTVPSERILEGLGIARAFRWIVGGDGPFPRKPDPAALRELMRRAETTPDDTVMVGDSAIDVRTAHAAGVRVCLARYGFGYRLDAADLRGDELLVDSPHELPRLIGAPPD